LKIRLHPPHGGLTRSLRRGATGRAARSWGRGLDCLRRCRQPHPRAPYRWMLHTRDAAGK